jgi:hypothetical protein
VRELLRWYGAGSRDVTVRIGPAVPSGSKGTATQLILVSPDGSDLSAPAFKRAAFHVAGTLRVDLLGGDWLTAAHVTADQGRWIAVLGTLGILVLTGAVGVSGLAEFLRTGRALAPLAVLTGTRRIFIGTAAVAILCPMILAGLVGEFAGTWMALPVIAGGAVLSTPFLLATAAAVAAAAAGIFAWGATIAVREAGRWQPGKA